ncbi:DinB family protein [Phycisphaerae bacterium RAS1]|nr:DinB family protein [Phycisphaerae bacterium RAS1]
MVDLTTVRTLLVHNDWANGELLRCAAPLPAAPLDRPIDMGVGSLRRTLLHIYNGEHVWLQRWRRQSETPWPSEDELVAMADLSSRFTRQYQERDAFLATLTPADVARAQVYRDSKGGLFTATLGDMLLQALHHSAHHRAQAVNMLRQVGAEAPELDYMVRVRRPVAT